MSDSPVNLLELAQRGGTGPIWATESDDLDCTFVAWGNGQGVVEHVNTEVDVVMVVLSGNGSVLLDGRSVDFSPGTVLMIPKEVSRAIHAGEGGVAYLNVHKRRKRLHLGNPATRIHGQQNLPRS